MWRWLEWMRRLPLLHHFARSTAAIASARTTSPAWSAAATIPTARPETANDVQLPQQWPDHVAQPTKCRFDLVRAVLYSNERLERAAAWRRQPIHLLVQLPREPERHHLAAILLPRRQPRAS